MDEFEFDPRGQGDRFLFHYTSAGGLAGILDSGEFRLSTRERLNDPRESKDLNTGFFRIKDDPEFPPDDVQPLILKAFNGAFKDNVRIGCFTTEGSESGSDGYFSRGFARARSWAQYGDAHRGAVLVLDRSRLVDFLEADRENYRWGPVEYADRSSFDLNNGEWYNIRTSLVHGVSDYSGVARRERELYCREFYFRKNLDWASESEFRVIHWGLGDEKGHIPVAGLLVGVVLGESFPIAEANVLAVRLCRLGIDRIQVGQMVWGAGTPGCVPVGSMDVRGFRPILPYLGDNTAPLAPYID